MKIAVIGSGISGMAAAHWLAPEHEVHLYEAAPRLGGHTATVDVDDDGQQLAIDTGFIVFNDRTYPEFVALMTKLGVASKPTRMSFSVSDSITGLEYAGSSLDTLFAQRRNLLSPRFLRLVHDILRFNREAESDLLTLQERGTGDMPLGDYLREFGYSAAFTTCYLLPMGAAIWSSNHSDIAAFPLRFFIRFFRNHGLLSLRNRPQWQVIEGGSRNYIAPLCANFRERIHVNTQVSEVRRNVVRQGSVGCIVRSTRGEELFDEVILACHSDQALRLLADPTEAEREILGAIPYTRNEVVLHTDINLLPRDRRCWSSWNVSLGSGQTTQPALTYNMNILQGLRSKQTWCVTLNQTEAIRPHLIHGRFHYDHPLFSVAGIAAQRRLAEINGVNRTWYCGAWLGNGFHEDGVASARRVATELGELIFVSTSRRLGAGQR